MTGVAARGSERRAWWRLMEKQVLRLRLKDDNFKQEALRLSLRITTSKGMVGDKGAIRNGAGRPGVRIFLYVRRLFFLN